MGYLGVTFPLADFVVSRHVAHIRNAKLNSVVLPLLLFYGDLYYLI